jgi:hypothetical protein
LILEKLVIHSRPKSTTQKAPETEDYDLIPLDAPLYGQILALRVDEANGALAEAERLLAPYQSSHPRTSPDC